MEVVCANGATLVPFEKSLAVYELAKTSFIQTTAALNILTGRLLVLLLKTDCFFSLDDVPVFCDDVWTRHNNMLMSKI